MKAIVQDTYSSTAVLEFRDIAPPVPKDNEVLVRAHAAGLHRGTGTSCPACRT
jgi:NADPH:quinone reductase-like Zn-dependent oxidoreductase